jgi:hypothetical protein
VRLSRESALPLSPQQTRLRSNRRPGLRRLSKNKSQDHDDEDQNEYHVKVVHTTVSFCFNYLSMKTAKILIVSDFLSRPLQRSQRSSFYIKPNFQAHGANPALFSFKNVCANSFKNLSATIAPGFDKLSLSRCLLGL